MQMTKRLLSFSLLASLVIAPLHLRAQEHGAPHATETKHEAKPEEPKPEEHGAASHETAKPEGHEGQMHEGQAHEGSEHGGGHHGPAVKLFGTELNDTKQWLVQLFNFLVFAGGIIFLAKGAMSAAFKARKEELETLLAQAAKDKAEGEAQIKELEAKMAGLEGELKGIMAKAEQDADAEKARVIDAAKTEAATILAQAQSEIDFQKRQAEQELRALVAELATEGAAKRLQTQLQGASGANAMDRAITQIGQSQGGLQ
jgi:F-type H+-transporting ATPase subunit b